MKKRPISLFLAVALLLALLGGCAEGNSGRVDPQASGSGGEAPVVMSRSYPKFRGAVVLCSGEGAALTLRVKQALSSLTGLGMDKISVLKMN